MTKWEYTRSAIAYEHNMERMNRLGSEGWELVAMVDGRGYFKRPIPEPVDEAKAQQIKESIDRKARSDSTKMPGYYPF